MWKSFLMTTGIFSLLVVVGAGLHALFLYLVRCYGIETIQAGFVGAVMFCILWSVVHDRMKWKQRHTCGHSPGAGR
jgi:hypothetical protein